MKTSQNSNQLEEINMIEPEKIFPDSTNLISHCPLCNTKEERLETNILEEKEGAFLVHVHCRNCGGFIVSLVMSNVFGVSSVGLISDLTSNDFLKFKNQSAISPDDVLEFYRFFSQR